MKQEEVLGALIGLGDFLLIHDLNGFAGFVFDCLDSRVNAVHVGERVTFGFVTDQDDTDLKVRFLVVLFAAGRKDHSAGEHHDNDECEREKLLEHCFFSSVNFVGKSIQKGFSL